MPTEANKELVHSHQEAHNINDLDVLQAILHCNWISHSRMPRPDHASAVVAMALDMQAAVQVLSNGALSVRIGIHSGPVVAGVIGQKKFSYDLWGDTVNVASRMESHGQAGAIQVSAATYQLIRHAFRCTAHGRIQVKGKGAMEVWHILGPQTESTASHRELQGIIGESIDGARRPDALLLPAALS